MEKGQAIDMSLFLLQGCPALVGSSKAEIRLGRAWDGNWLDLDLPTGCLMDP